MQDSLTDIIMAGVQGADPERILRERVCRQPGELVIDEVSYDLSQYDRVLLLGAGKAAARMAVVLEDLLGEILSGGIVVVKHGHVEPVKRVTLMEGGHPVPDEAGVAGATALLDMARQTTERDLVIFALTGGASAVTPLPAMGLTLAEKQEATGLLLSCGATIHEVNAVRKHLSAFKGGQFARALAPSTVVSLIISDVVGDDLDVIGSGPTAPDRSSFRSALAVVGKYDLGESMPQAVMTRLSQGVDGTIVDTPGAGDACFDKVDNRIIGSNTLALRAAAKKARELGFAPLVVTSRLQGEAREAAKVLVSIAESSCQFGEPIAAPCCILAGGETTVTINGSGKGGRNQEMVLAALCALEHSPFKDRICVGSIGTDGTDGPTDAAGACAAAELGNRCSDLGLDPHDFLSRNDSYHFFDKTGDLLLTGPTGTNVMDLVALLVHEQ